MLSTSTQTAITRQKRFVKTIASFQAAGYAALKEKEHH